MLEDYFWYVYIAGACLIPFGTAVGHGAGWWDAAPDDDGMDLLVWLLAWLLGLALWPVVLLCFVFFAAVALPIIGLVALGNYVGSKLTS